MAIVAGEIAETFRGFPPSHRMTRIRFWSFVIPEAHVTLRTEWPAPAGKILDAADRLLARYGYRKMTVEDLAKEAGIGKGSVYLSFDAKPDIALACIDRMVARLLVRLEAIAAGPGSAEQRLRAML